jgi:hypothetical protein
MRVRKGVSTASLHTTTPISTATKIKIMALSKQHLSNGQRGKDLPVSRIAQRGLMSEQRSSLVG